MMGPWAASIQDDVVGENFMVLGRELFHGTLDTFSADAVHRNVAVRVSVISGLHVGNLLRFIHFF
jgi:hypothetical protein